MAGHRQDEDDTDDDPSGGARSDGVEAPAARKLVCRAVDNADDGLDSLADGQDDGAGELRLVDEPSWALAQTQEPPQDPRRVPMAASSPSTGEVTIRLTRNPGGSTGSTGTKEDGAVESRMAYGHTSQVILDARKAGGGSDGEGGDPLNKQIDWAPAAQAVFDLSDYDGLPETQEALEGIAGKVRDVDRKAEAKSYAVGEERPRKVRDGIDSTIEGVDPSDFQSVALDLLRSCS